MDALDAIFTEGSEGNKDFAAFRSSEIRSPPSLHFVYVCFFISDATWAADHLPSAIHRRF
jgi:hypothetical protein